MTDSLESNDNTHTHQVLTKGTMVGRYRIIEKIGAGGMGEVYLAQDTELDRRVALKFLPTHLCQDDDCRQRFKREAQAAAKLDHANIVPVYEVGEHDGRPFFAMAHIEGQPLREVIRGGELGLDEAIDLTIQICEGLQEAHESGIVHRDIKPSNIILDKKGRPKLVDFGLATVQGGERLTKTGSTLGTAGYMSPEQIKVKEVDQRSDLFSLGVVLYEMITSRLPFSAETEAATMNAVLRDAPEPLSRYKSGVTAELQRIVSKLLEKDSALRYQSAAGVASDLKGLTASSLPDKKPRKDWWNRYVVPGAVLVFVIAVVIWVREMTPETEDEGVKSIAVLPFENLGAAEDEYFADGITDEITARVAGISGLRVISRTSAMFYKDSPKPLPEIGKELGVNYIIEGTIRWDKSSEPNRVRITPQLIRVADDSHVWADNFEHAMTRVFAVQSEIANKIAENLGVTLLESEKTAVNEKPTENLTAYNYYLRGLEYWDQDRSVVQAITMLEKATELDSTYLKAHMLLARLYGYVYINNLQLFDDVENRAREAAETAFSLAQGKSDGYLAMGYYHYYCSRDYDRALELFQRTLIDQPNNSDLIAAIAYVQRRQGHWEKALNGLRKALRLNPLSATITTGLAMTLYQMHRHKEGLALVNDALEIAPDHPSLWRWQMTFRFFSGQDTSVVREAMNTFRQYASRDLFAYWAELADISLRDFQTALTRRSSPGEYQLTDSIEFYLQRGRIYRFMGDETTSRAYFDSVKVICEERLVRQPDHPQYQMSLGIALAGLGDKAGALQHGERATELLSVEKDALSGNSMLMDLAEIYATVGQADRAIDLITYLLENPSPLQFQDVKWHPTYDPLRAHPRFQALLEKYE